MQVVGRIPAGQSDHLGRGGLRHAHRCRGPDPELRGCTPTRISPRPTHRISPGGSSACSVMARCVWASQLVCGRIDDPRIILTMRGRPDQPQPLQFQCHPRAL
eukprot:UN2795